MKQITIVRHAKSDWGNEYLKDIDRPLNERGYRDAYYSSEWYVKNQEVPGCIVSSPATRALNTALIFARAMSLPLSKIRLEQEIYEAPVEKLLSVIHSQDDGLSHIMLFGHNPGFTNLANTLSNGLFFDNVPTCGIISIGFAVKRWDEVQGKQGNVLYHHFPKEFRMKD